ncbi:MAG: CocE/NonD family hydrolase [Actinomycetota bacterium]
MSYQVTARRISSFALAVVAVAAVLLALPQRAQAAPNGYVTMSDGTSIAINVRMPDTFEEGQRYPTIFEMSGYDGGSATGRTISGDIADETGATFLPLQDDSRQLTKFYYKDYVTIHASVRGTGCSGGEFDLFSWRSALDGHEVIEWIAQQPWSNGNVGLMGHSYGGITGFMIAATQPPHLRAATLSGLIDDLYRGITYPGGVSNYGFPLIWTGGIRMFYDVGGGTAPGIVRTQDPQCMQNLASHRRTILNDPIVQGVSDVDGDWWRTKSLGTYADRIEVPIHIAGAYQDEQTGPRFPHLFEMVEGVPKRLVMLNGDHGTQQDPFVMADRVKWMDHWMRGIDAGYGSVKCDDEDDDDDCKTSVTTYLDVRNTQQGIKPSAQIDSKTFPLEKTEWTNYYLRADGGLSTQLPGASEGSDDYFSGSPRQSWSYQAGPTAGSEFSTAEGPDELTFRSEAVTENTVIAGPITSTLFISSTSPDPELFVQLIDEAANGDRTYLQRGMLKASHRALNLGMSDWDGNVLYRPFHPHTNPTPVTPGTTYEYLVEIFPVGHVFRPGHRIVVKIHTPPAADSFYAYVPKRLPGVNTVLHDAAHPSRIMLPVQPVKSETDFGPEPTCGELHEERCIPA